MSGPEKRKDVCWIQRFDNFKRAFAQLTRAAVLAKERDLSELEEHGLIHAFEFTHELAWTTLKDFLEARGSTEKLYGSKDATRAAFAGGLIENGDAWMEMFESRNETVHTYDQNTARRIAQAIRSTYLPQFEKFHQKFTELELDQK
jgi:nucleotidyltransferase substrate binding protein (TIGR01987 family)